MDIVTLLGQTILQHNSNSSHVAYYSLNDPNFLDKSYRSQQVDLKLAMAL